MFVVKCEYIREHQHRQEYSHSKSEQKPASSGASVNNAKTAKTGGRLASRAKRRTRTKEINKTIDKEVSKIRKARLKYYSGQYEHLDESPKPLSNTVSQQKVIDLTWTGWRFVYVRC